MSSGKQLGQMWEAGLTVTSSTQRLTQIKLHLDAQPEA